MEEYRHNFKEIEKGRGPSPLNLMECEKSPKPFSLYHILSKEYCNEFIVRQFRTDRPLILELL
jgi:hypothetical protein